MQRSYQDSNNRRGKAGKQLNAFVKDTSYYDASLYGKTRKTPDEIALGKLQKALVTSVADESSRRYYLRLMENSDQLRFMNMETLAKVFQYYKRIEGNVTNKDNITLEKFAPFINELLHTDKIRETEDELKLTRLRFAATFIRYLDHINDIKIKLAQEAEQIGYDILADELSD